MSTRSACRFLACRPVATVRLGVVSAVPLALWVAVPCVPCVPCGCVLSAPLCDGLGMCLRCGCVPCEGAFRCALCVGCPVLCSGRCVAYGNGAVCVPVCPCALWLGGAYGRAVFVAVCGCEPVFCVPWLCGCAAVCSACG
ncbi:hypothetical protein SEA_WIGGLEWIGGLE_145 [Mycobacterium phage Wigglewiggle]|nr:hypothetical protein SEA_WIGGLEWIGGLE_145 [Mycobacterium phage Wigglewiggle]